MQILVTLRFYATGSFLRVDGDLFGLHISTVSRIVTRVTDVIASLRPQFVNFPEGNELPRIQEQFYAVSRIPGIVGAIDCTHISILSPGGDHAELFRNRKGFFSINVQVIGDVDPLIRNVVARWPGSTHDSRIFENSDICHRFQQQEIEGILLGDNGYPLRPYLMTPLFTENKHSSGKKVQYCTYKPLIS